MTKYSKYYLYRHIRHDTNEPFYIGIGKRGKCALNTGHCGRAKQTSSRNPHWLSIVNITTYDIEILFESDSREIIISKEMEFIKLYGRSDINTGPLSNLTDGGEFFEGYVPSAAVLKHRSITLKGRVKSKESIQKMLETRKENNSYVVRDETRKKQALAKMGRKLSEESVNKRQATRVKKALENNGKFYSKEALIRIGEARRERLFPKAEREQVLIAYETCKVIAKLAPLFNKNRLTIIKLLKEYNVYEGKNSKQT